MRTATRVLGFAGALALVATTATAQNGNDATFNNGSDFYTLFSVPTSGASIGTNPPDITGDLYWRALSGAEYMNDMDTTLGQTMSITGYFETVLSEQWVTSPNFLDRTHGPAVFNGATLGLEPTFFTAGLTSEVLVVLGSSGTSHPCTLYPSLCSPPGSSCAPGGGAWAWAFDVSFGSTAGAGVTMAADGTAASDMATTYFIQGGQVSTGGPCGLGTYETNAMISVDETQGDSTTLGINPRGGFQVSGSGPIQWGIATAMEANVQFHGNIMNMVADTGTGLGPESNNTSTGTGNGGGATNGLFLSLGSGISTLGVELRDGAGAVATPVNIGIAGASLAPIPGPGIPVLGGWLKVTPDGTFNSTSAVWQGSVVIDSPWFAQEGRMIGAQVPVPLTAAGATLNTQGATFDLLTFTADTTNVAQTILLP